MNLKRRQEWKNEGYSDSQQRKDTKYIDYKGILLDRTVHSTG